MANKYTGMQDMFIQQEIDEKTQEFNEARKKLEDRIKDIESGTNEHDYGMGDVEDRNEINDLRNEIHYLEKNYNKEIEILKSKQK